MTTKIIIAAPYPQDDPDGWQVTIGTIAIPETLCKIGLTGLTTGVALDKKKAAGRSGATITYQGDDLATFSIQLESWNRDGWRVLMAVCGMAQKQKGAPIVMHHPMLDAAGVDKAIVEKVKWPGNDSTELQKATLECTQWVPTPKKKPVTKTATVADVPDALTLHKQGKKDFKLPPAAKPTPPSKKTPKL